MTKKKRGLYHSQITGIIWISVVLVTVFAIKLFSSDDGKETRSDDTTAIQNREKLEKLEDSVYRQRRHSAPRERGRREWRVDGVSKGKNTPASWVDGNARGGEAWSSPVRREPLTVELNTADTTTLMLLHGIGPAYARRIVQYRERLGGFVNMGQLLEVYGFTEELLDHIAPHLRLDTAGLRRIPVNSIGLKQLIRHPYVEYYFARDLVNLRSRGVVFGSPDDLRAIPSATDTALARLLPYIDFSLPSQ